MKGFKLLEGDRRKYGTGPGAKIFSSEILAGVPQVLVHIRRIIRLALTLLIEVLEQFIARDITAALTSLARRLSFRSIVFSVPLAAKLKRIVEPEISTS